MRAARYPGRCQCGAAVQVGDPVAFGEGYRVRGALAIILCPSCRPVSVAREWRDVATPGGAPVRVCAYRDARTGALTGYRVEYLDAADSGGGDWASLDTGGVVCRSGREWRGMGPATVAHVLDSFAALGDVLDAAGGAK